ncbi:hypothetical protein BJV78DRAFT_1361558 [Lactifluus subvellereus]|nr:hypothetical protein BJV78DRAFT_1361558 [Lactifluus subvellereus]
MPLSMSVGHCYREPRLDPPSASTHPLPSALSNLGSDLPNELLNAIFDHLSQDALSRVALVSRRWRDIAERLLYTAIVIDEVLPRTSPGGALKGTQTTMPTVPAATLRCCETLSSRPHLTEYVRRFHMRWQTDAVESPALLLLIAQNVLGTLVPTLVHLDELELAFGLAEHIPALLVPSPSDSGGVATATAFLLRPFRLPSLRTLALRGIGGEPPEHVLRDHPALQHLRLGDYRKPLRLRPTDVPHLRTFCGHPVAAASVLPGRPVQALGLVGCESATERDLACIAAGSLPLRSLDLSAMSVTLTLLRNLSRHLSHVEWLRVRLALRHTLHYALPGIRLLTVLTTVLAAFYNLRSLDLSPTSAAVATCDGQNAVEEHHLCMVWMGACPSLRRVIFPSRTGWSLSETGTWISDTSGSRARCYLATPVRPR